MKNRRVATWQIIVLVLILLPAAFSGPAAAEGPFSASAAAQPVLFGQFAGNVLVGIYYTNPVTQQVIIIDSGSNVPVDTLQVAAANGGPPVNLTFAVEQYVAATVNQQAAGPNNTTITRPVVVQESVQWDNQTISLASHQVEQYQLSIPQASQVRDVIVSAGGASWQFTHRTSPAALPAFMTQGGELGLLASAVVLSSIVWAVGVLTGKIIIDRAKYWPARSLAGWIVLAVAVAFIGYGAAGAFYFDLAYIPWYSWLIPLYYVSSAFSIGAFRPDVERWDLEHITGSAREDTLEMDIRSPLVAPDEEYGYQWISRKSRKAAIARLFGRKIAVKFVHPKIEGGKVVRPWSAENRLCEDRVYDTRRTYWIDPRTDGEKVGMRTVTYHELAGGSEPQIQPRRFLRRSPSGRRMKEYAIPLSGSYTQTIPEFVSGLLNNTMLGEELEKTRWQKEEAEARLAAKVVDFDKQKFGARAAAAGFIRDTRDEDGYKRATDSIRKQAGNGERKAGDST